MWRALRCCAITDFMSEDRLPTRADALDILDWYRMVGVDFAVTDEPVDRFAKPAARLEVRPESASPVLLAPADGAEPRQIAEACDSLEALRAAMAAYEGCALKKRATRLVFADGNPAAEIMLVGEAPGEAEDLEGRPFVGPAGQLLDRMLGAIGLDRTQVYLANMVPWRPPGSRDTSPEELALCAPFVIRQIELVAPRILITLGNTPTRALFETKDGITRLRGQWRSLEIGRHRVKAMAMLHPAYLLNTPASKALAWSDLLGLKAELHEAESARG